MLLVLLSLSAVATADDWTTHRADDFGYSMLVPAGTSMVEKTWPGGWGGLRGESEGVVVVGVAKLGAPEAAADIERFGVEVTVA